MNASLTEKRFKIAFSFTGEKRHYVEKTVEILASKFGKNKILYDKYHRSEFARNDLGVYLPELYNNECDLLVAVLCEKYDEKEWTGLEWLAIHGILQQKRREEVLLSRFDYAKVKGLYQGAGYIELNETPPEEFADIILERLALNEGKTNDHYINPPISAAYQQPYTTIKHNLPTLQPFFGRKEELKKIAEAIKPENRTWGALINAPGGMGKTSLAVRAAYAAPAAVFSRIIFITLKSRELDDNGERELGSFVITGLQELFNELAQELNRPDIAQTILEQRPKLIVEALRGMHVLLVLDNLESLTKTERDILFTFVNRLPEGCKAILTSRGRIGSGGMEIILERLDEAAALKMLTELANHNRELAKTSESERKQLYTATAGKPLLLRWTAGQIGRGHCLTIGQAIDFLRSCPEGNDPLGFIFGDLVQDFTDIETKVICALTYFTLPTKAEHIANVATHNAEEVTRALQSLVNRSIVVPSEELQTFTLVPLVTDFLRKHKPEVLMEAGGRIEKYAYALILENGYQQHELFPVLDVQWPVIAAALPSILTGDNSRLQDVCNAFQFFLEYSGRWDESLALNIEAEKRAVSVNDLEQAGWRANNTGWMYRTLHQYEEVIKCANRAERYWYEAGMGDREKAMTLQLRGMGHRLAENYPAAIEAFKQSVELYRKLDPVSLEVATGLNSLANAENVSGDYATAELDYSEAIRIAKIIEDKEGIATYITNLSEIAFAKKEWNRAEILILESLPICEKIGRQQLIAGNCARLALSLAMQDRKNEGLPYAKRAVDIHTRLDSPDLVKAKQILKLCEE